MQVEGTSFDKKVRTAAVGLEVINPPDEGLVKLQTIYYDLDVSNLTVANILKIAEVCESQIVNKFKKIWIYGYTDRQTGVDNQKLSQARASKVTELIHAVVPTIEVGYKYFGPANPVDPAHTQAAYALNRRSEIYGQP